MHRAGTADVLNFAGIAIIADIATDIVDIADIVMDIVDIANIVADIASIADVVNIADIANQIL